MGNGGMATSASSVQQEAVEIVVANHDKICLVGDLRMTISGWGDGLIY